MAETGTSLQALIKSVAQKLKYYLEVQRMEECFDLSAVNNPRPSLEIKQAGTATFWSHLESETVRKRKVTLPKSPRRLLSETDFMDFDKEREIRADLEHYMATVSYKPKRCKKTEHPFLGSKHVDRRKQAAGTGDRSECNSAVSQRTRRGNSIPSRSSKNMHDQRGSPAWHVSPLEQEKLLMIATKIILLMENMTDDREQGELTYRKAGKKARTQRTVSSRGSAMSSATNRSYHKDMPPPLTPSIPEWLRYEMQKVDVTDDEAVRDNIIAHSQPQRIQSRPPSAETVKRQVAAAKQTEKWVYTGTMEDTSIQTDPLEVPVLEAGSECVYNVRITTGKKIGAGTAADIHITIFGENGRTRRTYLHRSSKKKRRSFRKDQMDTFKLESYHLGKLVLVRIGHESFDLRDAWFLEKVEVVDPREKQHYVFPCRQWLSAVDGDKKTVRDLKLASVQRASKLLVDGEDEERGLWHEESLNKMAKPHGGSTDTGGTAKQEDINSLIGEIDRMSMQSTPSLSHSDELELNLCGRPSRDASRLSGKTSWQSIMRSLRFGGGGGGGGGGDADDNEQTDVEATCSELQQLPRAATNSSSNSDADGDTARKQPNGNDASMPSYSASPTPPGDSERQFNSAASMSRRTDGHRKRGSRISFDDNDSNTSERGEAVGLDGMKPFYNHSPSTFKRGRRISFKNENNDKNENDLSSVTPALTAHKLQEMFSFFDDNQVAMTSSGFFNDGQQVLTSMDSMVAQVSESGDTEE